MSKRGMIGLVLLIATACAGPGLTKDELVAKGRERITSNDVRSAIILFKDALQKDQNFVEARLELGKAYAIIGKAAAAEKEFQKVLRQMPASREAHIECARLALLRRDHAAALAEVQPYLSNDPLDIEAVELAGMAFALRGSYDAALTNLGRVIEAEPSRESAFIAIAKVKAAMGNGQGAKEQLSLLLQKDQRNRAARYALAELQTAEGDTTGASATYETILAAYPGDLRAAISLGLLHLRAGRYADAMTVAELIIKRPSGAAVGYRLKGIALYQMKRYKESAATLQRSVALSPHQGSYYYLGLAHYSLGELEHASNSLRQALDLNEHFGRGRTALALVLLRKGQAGEAIAELRKALSLDEDDAQAHSIMGLALVNQGRYAEGIQELKLAIELDPKLTEARIKKGLIEFARGREQDAEADLSAAVQVEPELLSSRVLLALFQTKRGELESALTTLRSGIRNRPEDAVLYTLIGETQLRLHRTQDAIKAFASAKRADPGYDAPYFRLASLFLGWNERGSAMAEMRELLAKQPENIRGLTMLAAMLESGGDVEQAARYYHRARTIGKTDGYLEEAAFILRRGDLAGSISLLEEAIRRHPSDPAPYDLKGRIELANRRFNDAVRTFESLERIQPDLGRAHLLNAYVAMQKPDMAVEKVRAALKKEPGRVVLRAELSRMYQSAGRTKDAVETASGIISEHPDAAIGYRTLAKVKAGAGDVEGAITVLRAGTSVQDPELLIDLGDLYLLQKRHEEALRQYDRAAALRRSSVTAMVKRAAALHRMGRTSTAISEYQRVLRSDPNHVTALNNLAYLLAESKSDLPGALQLAAAAYMQAPRNAEVLDTFGYVLLKSGKTDEAAAVLARAQQELPDNPAIRYHMALASSAQGKRSEAIMHLQRALEERTFEERSAAIALLAKLSGSGGGHHD